MKEHEFYAATNEMVMHCQSLLHSKHNEYATEDHFHNFTVASVLQGITPAQALLGMMDKHVVSVHDLVNEAAEGRKVTNEQWLEKSVTISIIC